MPQILRSGLILALLTASGLTLLLAGCGAQEKLSEDQLRPVRELRFGGVSAIHALRRVASEAGLPLALDEIRPEDGTPDLGIRRVDIDLPAGPVQKQLEALREATGAFDFEILDGVIYVRSNLPVDQPTMLDQPYIPELHAEGTLETIVQEMMKLRPNLFVTVMRRQDYPLPTGIKMDAPANSTPLDIFRNYARLSKGGWWMRRAGQLLTEDPKQRVFIATVIEPWPALGTTARIPIEAVGPSVVNALADVAARTGSGMVVLDRALQQDVRGGLSYRYGRDPQLPLEASLKAIYDLNVNNNDPFLAYELVDGLPVIRSRDLVFRLPGQEILHDKLKGGSFKGSLPDLARFINANQSQPTGRYLMGGEFVEGQPTASIEIAPGAKVLDAIEQFARASKLGICLTVMEDLSISGAPIEHPGLWHGGFLQYLDEWSSRDLGLRF